MEKKKFLKIPEFPGGKEAFKHYIDDNLRYPEEAVRQKIEGIVHLSADIDDNGKVLDIVIEKGLGYGCDEEAARLVHELHFGGVSNRGIRLKTRKKFRIRFSLDEIKSRNKDSGNIKQKSEVAIKYTYIPEKDSQEKLITEKHAEKLNNPEDHYSYTITWK